MTEVCPQCGLRFEREEGAFLGSLALNYGVSGVVGIGVVVGWILSGADPGVTTVMLTTMGVTLAAVLFFYPFAKTTWSAIDLLLHRDAEPPQSP